MPSVCYFHINTSDDKKSKVFYEDLFGWKINEREMGGHTFQEISDTWPRSLTKSIEGSISAPMHNEMPQGIVVYFDVPSLDEALAKVIRHGGSQVSEKMAIPGEGYLAVCKDPLGVVLGLWENNQQAQ